MTRRLIVKRQPFQIHLIFILRPVLVLIAILLHLHLSPSLSQPLLLLVIVRRQHQGKRHGFVLSHVVQRGWQAKFMRKTLVLTQSRNPICRFS